MVRDQNQGFAQELSGYEFKPRMNKKSADLANSMKNLTTRMPEMMAERHKYLTSRRKERDDVSVTFADAVDISSFIHSPTYISLVDGCVVGSEGMQF